MSEDDDQPELEPVAYVASAILFLAGLPDPQFLGFCFLFAYFVLPVWWIMRKVAAR